MNPKVPIEIRKLATTRANKATTGIRKYLMEHKGVTSEEAIAYTKHYYTTYKRGFIEGYTLAMEKQS